MRLHVGCAMWAHRPWIGRFVDASLPPTERLRAYARWCNAVEGNTTFYAVPAAATVATWAARTEPDFRFLAKAPREITHERRLRDVGAPLTEFLDALEALGPRLHAVWVQLPSSFAPADVGALGGFLRRLPVRLPVAVEVRHRAFFEDHRAEQLLERALAGSGAEWAPFDTTTLFQSPPTTDAERDAWTKKPRVPRRARALTDRPIVRYIGRDDPDATERGWAPWSELVAQWIGEGRSPTVFVHTPDNADAPDLARRFHASVRERVPELDPLPAPAPPAPTTLF